MLLLSRSMRIMIMRLCTNLLVNNLWLLHGLLLVRVLDVRRVRLRSSLGGNLRLMHLKAGVHAGCAGVVHAGVRCAVGGLERIVHTGLQEAGNVGRTRE